MQNSVKSLVSSWKTGETSVVGRQLPRRKPAYARSVASLDAGVEPNQQLYPRLAAPAGSQLAKQAAAVPRPPRPRYDRDAASVISGESRNPQLAAAAPRLPVDEAAVSQRLDHWLTDSVNKVLQASPRSSRALGMVPHPAAQPTRRTVPPLPPRLRALHDAASIISGEARHPQLGAITSGE